MQQWCRYLFISWDFFRSMGSHSERGVPERTVSKSYSEIELPVFRFIEQLLDANSIPEDQISEHDGEGGEVAVGVGSRVITNISLLVHGVINTGNLRMTWARDMTHPSIANNWKVNTPW